MATPPKPPPPAASTPREALKADRLIAIIDPRNRPSQRVAEKLGLVLERETDNQGRWNGIQRIYATSLTDLNR